jgi:hypothetical protein
MILLPLCLAEIRFLVRMPATYADPQRADGDK